MAEAPQQRPAGKGLWWKSLLLAWLGLQAVSAVSLALGVDVPEAAGFPALIFVWALIWLAWWRRSAAKDQEPRLFGPGPLGVMQRFFAAIVVAILIIGEVVLILDTSGGLDRTDVPVGVVAAAVTLVGLFSLIGARIAVPRLDWTDAARLVTSYRSRLFGRVAWAEVPALVAFAGFLLLGGEAWVFGIGLMASLANLARAAPTRASVRRDQERLRPSRSTLDLLSLLSPPPTPAQG